MSTICDCGCGASTIGWSNAGRAHGMRDGVERVQAAAHGRCQLCGLMLDQYGDCGQCGEVPGALDRVHAAHEALLDAEGRTGTLRDRRDALIAKAVEAGITKYRVSAALGISQHAVTKIIDRHDHRVSG